MQHNLKTICLSGGIATGKSTCVKIIQRLLPGCVIFDADTCVRDLYLEDEIQKELTSRFGCEVVFPNGEINKEALRNLAFADTSSRQELEEVFHPRVREECLALLRKTTKNKSSRLFVADIPLLFEKGFDFGQSANLLVATSGQTQIERLKNRNAWCDTTVQAVISAQMPLGKKMILADSIFWNEGSVEMLEKQCRRYFSSCGLI